MKTHDVHWLFAALGVATLGAAAATVAAAPPAYPFVWSTVVNNGDFMPTDLCDPTVPTPTTPPCRKFNSYNQ
ncbi:MAG: hypothetical protein H6R11_2220, partial [Proteobacteria bacterium]|nr:hypothetical protein [Pseudomonadota bacterium]